MWQNTWSDLFIQGNESETQMIPICSFHAVKHVTELTVYLSSPKWKGAAQTVFSVSEDFWWKGQTRIHSFTQWKCVRPLLYVHHMRRSSLGNGSGRPGFSVPPEPVCFLSSALGLYVPSILLFFLMTHSSSSSTKLSRDTNADTVGGINTCIAMLTNSFLRNLRYQGVLVLRSYIWTFTASVRYKWQRDVIIGMQRVLLHLFNRCLLSSRGCRCQLMRVQVRCTTCSVVTGLVQRNYSGQ